MKFEMVPVRAEEKEILRNLMEKYAYEFSQYNHRDVNDQGLYGYSYLDNYWTEENRWAFFLKADGKLAGFAMVNNYCPESEEKTDYSMAEFFVMMKYRRCGLGTWAAFQLFDQFPGTWFLDRHPGNMPAVRFWDKVIHEYTGGRFRLDRGREDLCYDDGTRADAFFFSTVGGGSAKGENGLDPIKNK